MINTFITGPATVAYIWLQQNNCCQLVQFSVLSLSSLCTKQINRTLINHIINYIFLPGEAVVDVP